MFSLIHANRRYDLLCGRSNNGYSVMPVGKSAFILVEDGRVAAAFVLVEEKRNS